MCITHKIYSHAQSYNYKNTIEMVFNKLRQYKNRYTICNIIIMCQHNKFEIYDRYFDYLNILLTFNELKTVEKNNNNNDIEDLQVNKLYSMSEHLYYNGVFVYAI